MARVLILTGAGLSAESGIQTFRAADGMWEDYDVMKVCSVEGFEDDRDLVTNFYNERRKDIEDKLPNEAHKMIARLKAEFPEDIAVLTQNVDDLLERAHCEDVVHLHGTLTDLRCEDCDTVFPIAYASQEGAVCPECDSDFIRHNVVMFGEAAPKYQFLSECIESAELLVVIGTSGQVLDTGYFAQLVGKSILNNLDIDEDHDQFFETTLYEAATKAAPKIESMVIDFLES